MICTLILLALSFQGIGGTQERRHACIKTPNQYHQSLVNRIVNLESLSKAFSPTDRQASITFTVYYHFCTEAGNGTSKVRCEDVEEWVSDRNSGLNPSDVFMDKYVYKFIWNSSPINIFIRPKLLASLSLFTFQVDERETHLVLDEPCDWSGIDEPNITNPQCDDWLEICRHPAPDILMLNELTAHLQSLNIHKKSFFTEGTGGGPGNERGFPTFYFAPRHHMTDVCAILQEDQYTINRYLLGSAIFTTQLLIPILIPFSARIFNNRIQALFSNKQSTSMHYYRGFSGATLLLGSFALVANIHSIATEENTDLSKSSICDVRMNYVFGLVIMIGIDPINLLINLVYNTYRKHGCHQFHKSFCSLYTASLSIITYTLNLLAFSFIYIFMGLIAAPVEAGSLVLFYSTAFFLLTMFFTLISLGYKAVKEFQTEKNNSQMDDKAEKTNCKSSSESGNTTKNIRINEEMGENPSDIEVMVTKKQANSSESNKTKEPANSSKRLANCCNGCDMFFAICIVVLLLASLILYLAFYYRMAIIVEPYTSTAGFLASFGSLIPAIFTLIAGILEKRLINFLSSKKNKKQKKDANAKRTKNKTIQKRATNKKENTNTSDNRNDEFESFSAASLSTSPIQSQSTGIAHVEIHDELNERDPLMSGSKPNPHDQYGSGSTESS